MPKKPLSRADASARYLVARRDLALNLPTDDALAIANVHGPAYIRRGTRITGTGLHADGIATTLTVAREAANIINRRKAAAGRKALVRQGWEVSRARPVWETDMAERLRRYHEGLVLDAWNAAGFREPSSRWVPGSGERVTISFDAKEGEERIGVVKRRVWARNGKYSANRVERNLILSREWVTNVLRRGIVGIFGEGTFVLRARPFMGDGSALDCILAVQGRGFDIGTESICIRRDESGWFAGLKRVDGKWKRTGKEVL